MAKLTAGQKRAEARRENREMRDKVDAMTNQQLKNFFGGFSSAVLARIEKAIAKVREELRDQEIAALDAQIKELTEQRNQLSK